MSSVARAQALLERVEQTVEAGDFVAAAELISGLKPLLNGAQIDELAALKTQVDSLNLRVHHRRGEQKVELKKLGEKNVAITQYRQIADA